MSIVARPELVTLIKSADFEMLAAIREANTAFKCSSFDCNDCPFNYAGFGELPKGYCGCIFADAGTERNRRGTHTGG